MTGRSKLMKLIAAMVWMCAAAVYADAPLIFDVGNGCGGDGPRNYAYQIDSVSYPMIEFRIGTNDLNPLHYTDVLVPDGWHFAIEKETMSHWCEGATPHGEVSEGPCRCLTAGSAYWWTDNPDYAVETFTFGFDHPWNPHDVGWDLLTRRPGPPPVEYEFNEFWDSPFGWGTGPVHGPLEREVPMELGPEEIVTTVSGTPITVLGYSVPSWIDWNSDGFSDLVVGEGGSGYEGKVRVYLNIGTVSEPILTDNWFYAQSNGVDLVVPDSGCLGAFPRMVDWDEDGLKDLVIGRADGYVMLFTNIGTSAVPTFDGGIYLQVGQSGFEVDINVGVRATPAIVDWNNDGKKDLVAGAMDSKIHIFINEGTNAAPVFWEEIFAQADGSDLIVPGSRCSPHVVDADADGKKDLLSGNTNGELIFYRNIGTDESPEFGDYEYVESDGIVIDLPGTPRSRPFVCDWTQDYLLDVLIGASDGQVHLYQGVYVEPFTLIVDPNPLIAGQDATFTVTNGEPSAVTALAYSLHGYGSTYVPQLDVTLDLDNPAQAGNLVWTDTTGTASWLLNVPYQAAGRDVWFQAVQHQSKTNVIETTIE